MKMKLGKSVKDVNNMLVVGLAGTGKSVFLDNLTSQLESQCHSYCL